MQIFPRQAGRPRRVGPDKVRVPLSAVGEHEPVGWVRPLLTGVVFAVLLVLAMTWGRPPLKYAPGDTAGIDITARVAFDFVDDEATRDMRRAERQRTPNVYRGDNEALEPCRAEILAALDRLRETPDVTAWPTQVAELIAVPDTERPLLLADVKRADGGIARAVVLVTLTDLYTRGVISNERAEEESSFPHGTVTALRFGEPPARLRGVLSVADAGDFVEESLIARLGPVGLKSASRAIADSLRKRLRPTLVFDPDASQRAKDEAAAAVGPQRVSRQPGDLLVKRNEVIWQRQYEMLRAEQEAFLAARDPVEDAKEKIGVLFIVGVAFVLAGLYLRHYRPRVLGSVPRLSLLGVLLVGTVFFARMLFHTPWIGHPLHLVPVAFSSIVLALAYDRRFACAATVFIVVMVGLAAGAEAAFRPLLALLAGGLVAALYAYDIRKRTGLLKIGLAAGLAHAVTIVAVGLAQFPGSTEVTGWARLLEPVHALGTPALLGLANGLGVGIVLTGLLPLLERAFHITTGISLLELGDLNQPALKNFAMRAPGSYNHSLSVAALAESAARAVGANDLLARVGSHFHDLGKLNKPNYFVENQAEQNPHDRLSPHMSALIIIAHVKDGLELARELRLPRRILDVIAEHHGTTAVEYFYRRACEEAGEDRPPDDYVFRYAGPRPRSRETAIVMLADSVESASRTLVEPTPAGIENLVRRIVHAKLSDGQLDECTLTLAELHTVERSLTRGLISIFHGRIKY